MSPKIQPLPLAYAKNGDEQFWEEKLHAAGEKLCMHSRRLDYFPFGLGWVGEVFSSFSLVSNVFSSHFQFVYHVLAMFPNTFSITPPFYHMLWQMLSSSHLYTWAKGWEHHPCSTLEAVACPKFLCHITPIWEWDRICLFNGLSKLLILTKVFPSYDNQSINHSIFITE